MYSILSTKEKGFSLVEALVAIFILSVAIVAPLQIAYQGIAATTFAKNQLTAEFLAQDAAEYILARKGEDSNGWLTTFGNCSSVSGCVIKTDSSSLDILAGDIAACSGTCPVMKYNSSTGAYSQTSGGGFSDSQYTRKVVLNTPITQENVQIIPAEITVSWGSSLNTKKTYTLRVNYYRDI